VLLAGCTSPSSPEPAPPPSGPAFLGLTTRAATEDEKKTFKLGDAIAGRVNGTVVEEVAADGPAAKAGIARGDVVLVIDSNRIYSDDDVQDFVRAASAGRKIAVLLRRPALASDELVNVILGAAEGAPPAGIHWEFAGPSQLDAALAEAKKRCTRVMVGISGAET